MAKSKKRSQKDEVMYHVGQMAFIAVLITILMVVVTVAKAQGF
jgi:hypothetical protein